MTATNDEARRARRRTMVTRVLSGGAAPALPAHTLEITSLGPELERLSPADAAAALYRIIVGGPPEHRTLAELRGRLEDSVPLLVVARDLALSDRALSRPESHRARVRDEIRRWNAAVAVAELGLGDRDLQVYTPGSVWQEVFVRALYEVALHRPPSPEELRIQLGLLDGGTGREAMVRGFASHPETRSRLLGVRRRGLRGRVAAARDRASYLATFRSLVVAAEQRRVAELVRDLSLPRTRPLAKPSGPETR